MYSFENGSVIWNCTPNIYLCPEGHGDAFEYTVLRQSANWNNSVPCTYQRSRKY